MTFVLGPETELAVSYAAADRRGGLRALMMLDQALGNALRIAREPIVGQMRLAWWREALERLDAAPPPAEPVLRALAAHVLPRGVSGTAMATMTAGWEALLADELSDSELIGHAEARGGRLFNLAAALLGAKDAVAAAGAGWALADLSRRLSDKAVATRCAAMACERLDEAMSRRWSRPGRPLGALALSARFDCRESASLPGSPKRVARLLYHRATGL